MWLITLSVRIAFSHAVEDTGRVENPGSRQEFWKFDVDFWERRCLAFMHGYPTLPSFQPRDGSGALDTVSQDDCHGSGHAAEEIATGYQYHDKFKSQDGR
ncbi:hypothetical protein PG999_001731 [Apiospora kogelbergensis]|uniref:Uncharacterized protein n=1 Tax=Apiospora kogelbergensis TaxID=1337665 RepID=A0AAW0R6C2_9PEZI